MHDKVFNVLNASSLNNLTSETVGIVPQAKIMRFDTYKKFLKFIRDEKKHILILQPNWERKRHETTLIIIDQELKFSNLELLQDAIPPQVKCSRCKINDTTDYSVYWSEKNRKLICKKCEDELRKSRHLKQLKIFQKNLLKFYRSKHCKYITFKETWTFFYKQYKMSRYDFDNNFVNLITNQLFKTKIILFNSPEDLGSYADIFFEWKQANHHRYKGGDKFSLWTIEGLSKN